MDNDIIITGIATPAYLLNIEVLRRRVGRIREILQESLPGRNPGIVYAIKANPFLIPYLADIADGYEVCSPGEFRICEREGVSMEQIVLSGVNKEEADIERILDGHENGEHSGHETAGEEPESKGIYTVESPAQLELLQRKAKERGIRLRVLLRVTSGNQFGSDPESVINMYRTRESYPNLIFRGLQLYSGTQKQKTDKFREELGMLQDLIHTIREESGAEVEELEYGPGLYVSYFTRKMSEDAPEHGDMLSSGELMQLKELGRILADMDYTGHITLEMGRFIAASCGEYLTRIADKKMNGGSGYLIVDGGINHLNYYGQTMAMKIPEYLHFRGVKRILSEQGEPWNVCGSLCTVADVLVKNMPLTDPQIGDVLVFRNMGAYSITEGIYLFLSRDMPAVYAIHPGNRVERLRDATAIDSLNGKAADSWK